MQELINFKITATEKFNAVLLKLLSWRTFYHTEIYTNRNTKQIFHYRIDFIFARASCLWALQWLYFFLVVHHNLTESQKTTPRQSFPPQVLDQLLEQLYQQMLALPQQ